MLGLGSSIVHSSNHEQRYSIALDGVNDLIQTNFLLDKDRSFTISIWFRTDSSDGFYLFGCSGTYYFFPALVGDTGLYGYNSGTTALVTFPSNWDDGNWHHFAHYYDKDDADDCKIWFDGSEITISFASNNSSAAATMNPTLSLCTRSGFDTSSTFVGSYGDFAAWNTELTDAQVVGVYNAGKYHNLNFDIGDYNQASNLNYFIRMGNGIGDMVVDDDMGIGANQQAVLLQNQIGTLGVGFGDELIVNGGFDTSVTLGDNGSGWVNSTTLGAGRDAASPASTVAFNGGGLKYDFADVYDEVFATAKTAGGANILVANRVYRIQHDITARPDAFYLGTRDMLGGGTGSSKGTIYSGATGVSFVTYHRFLTTEFAIYSVGPSADKSITIDNVSVKQVASGDIAIVKNGGALEAGY